MRSSVYSIPCNQDMLKESGIPMAIASTPFAKIPEDEVIKLSALFRKIRCKLIF